jgi:hypothetical protein
VSEPSSTVVVDEEGFVNVDSPARLIDISSSSTDDTDGPVAIELEDLLPEQRKS